jgi:hypothetical protein
MFLLLVCFSVVLSATNAGTTGNNVLVIPKVDLPPIIDGELDAEWDFPDVGLFVYTDKTVPETATDFQALFRAAWNDDGFYFYGRVIDDSIFAEGTNPWEQDCFEIYFDGDNSKGASYDGVDDVQWRYVYGYTADEAGVCDLGASGECAWLETSNGYDFELSLPATLLADTNIVLTDGAVIGFEVQVAENDTGVRDYIAKWWSESNNSYLQPDLFGTAMLGDDDIVADFMEEIELAPVIDGDNTGGEWDAVPEIKMSVTANQVFAIGGYQDFSSYFRAAWDADGFYFLGRVVDDIIYADGTNSWEQDCFEIYFDGDNSKGGSYDGVDDVQWRYVYGLTADEAGWCDLGASGECAWLETADGYNLELSLPATLLADTNIVLDEGTTIGFEVQVAENEGSGREAITKWWSNSDNSYLQPDLFGTVTCVGVDGSTIEDPGPPAGIEEVVAAGLNLSVPAILSADATVSYVLPNRGTVKAGLYNIAGQEVLSLVSGVQNAGAQSVAIDAAGLANGVYICKVSADNLNEAKKVTVLK